MQNNKLKTQVTIIGSGPSGLLLAAILSRQHISTIVLEKQQRDYVIARSRAGVLQPETVKLLHFFGLASRLKSEGIKRNGFNILFGEDKKIFIDLKKHTHDGLTIYGQSKLQEDLFFAADKNKTSIYFNVSNVRIQQIATLYPQVKFIHDDAEIIIESDFIAGCDGFHGITRQVLDKYASTLHYTYPVSWLGLSAESTPLTDITYVSHHRGFALASMRSKNVSRYYLQVPANCDINTWSDERCWQELRLRFPKNMPESIQSGQIINKSLTPIRLSILNTMQYGRLYLIGDAAHILPPTGAKGLNLALSNATNLAQALLEYYSEGNLLPLDTFTKTAMKKTKQAIGLSVYMTHILHSLPEIISPVTQQKRLKTLYTSLKQQAHLAMLYGGINV